MSGIECVGYVATVCATCAHDPTLADTPVASYVFLLAHWPCAAQSVVFVCGQSAYAAGQRATRTRAAGEVGATRKTFVFLVAAPSRGFAPSSPCGRRRGGRVQHHAQGFLAHRLADAGVNRVLWLHANGAVRPQPDACLAQSASPDSLTIARHAGGPDHGCR